MIPQYWPPAVAQIEIAVQPPSCDEEMPPSGSLRVGESLPPAEGPSAVEPGSEAVFWQPEESSNAAVHTDESDNKVSE
jgi:hypothetical protein